MTLNEFTDSGLACLICDSDKALFRSTEEGITPLIRFIRENQLVDDQGQTIHHISDLVIYDKYIGRAAALLMSLITPVEVYTPVISKFGKEVLERVGIPFTAEKQVTYLMGLASDEMCSWEKATVGKTAAELWRMLPR